MRTVDTGHSLVLLRHAKAEQLPPGSPTSDHDRRLTAQGRRDAVAAGSWLREHGVVPQLVICSTSRRTRETWAGAVAGGGHTEFVEYRRTVYAGGIGAVLDTIREDADEVDTLVVVGHAPTIPALATILADGRGSTAAHEALADGFPTTGLALLRYGGEWADLAPGTARLEAFHVCRG